MIFGRELRAQHAAPRGYPGSAGRLLMATEDIEHFEKTVEALKKAIQVMGWQESDSECAPREEMIRLCVDIALGYGEEVDMAVYLD